MSLTPEQPRPRILVVGCGGIGGVVASHLIATGHDVTVLCRNAETRDALQTRGFEVHGATSLYRVAATRLLAELPAVQPAFDYVLLCTQPPEVEAAARAVLPALAEHSRVVCLQNGLCEPRVGKIVGEQRVLGAVVLFGASTLSPGVFDRTSSGGFVLGSLVPVSDAELQPLAALLHGVGPVLITHNLLGARWSKLAINSVISTLGTVAGVRLGDLLIRWRARRLALEIISEVTRVAAADGVRLQRVPGLIDMNWMSLGNSARPNALRTALQHVALLAIGLRYRRLRSSMLAAIERGRPPAVGFLNGEVVDRATALGLSAPVNRAAVEAVLGIAAGERAASLQTLNELYRSTRGAAPTPVAQPVEPSANQSEAR